MTRSATPLAIIAALVLCLACFPGIAFAVAPAPGSGAETSGGGCPSHTGELVTLDDIDASHPAPAEDSAPPLLYAQAEEPDSDQAGEPVSAQAEVSGKKTLPLLVIVAGLDGIPYRDDFDWGEAIFGDEESLAAYYDDMSLGQFTFEPMNETCSYEDGNTTNEADKANDGIVHVTLDMQHCDWTDPSSEGFRSTFGPMLIEAIKAADAYVDFASYDTNGDGRLKTNEMALGFVIAGYEAAYTTDHSEFGDDKYLWSHAYKLNYLLTGLYPNSGYYKPDGVSVSDYIAIPEQERADVRSSIGTLAHELGHYLGLPDLYDTDYSEGGAWSQYRVSHLCLMNSGSWGSTSDGKSIPTAMSAPCRYLLGWLNVVELRDGDSLLISPQDFSAPSNDSGYVCAKIPLDGRSDEFYLVENRQYRGWDEALQPVYGSIDPDGGLLFWHVDRRMMRMDPYNVNGYYHHPAIMPLFVEREAGDGNPLVGERPYTGRAFFDEKLWGGLSASALGDYLVLPLYGTDLNNDVPSARTLSQIKVSFAAADGGILLRLGDKPSTQDPDDKPSNQNPDPQEPAEPTRESDDPSHEADDDSNPPKENPPETKDDDAVPAAESLPEEKEDAVIPMTENSPKARMNAAIPATGDPLQAGGYAAMIGYSLALLSICLLRRRLYL